MGDKIAQLVFEKNKTPKVLEMNSLDDTHRGHKGFRSTSVKATLESVNSVTKIQSASRDNYSKRDALLMNRPAQHVRRRPQLANKQQIFNAGQI